jgi:hypothetical protein
MVPSPTVPKPCIVFVNHPTGKGNKHLGIKKVGGGGRGLEGEEGRGLQSGCKANKIAALG